MKRTITTILAMLVFLVASVVASNPFVILSSPQDVESFAVDEMNSFHDGDLTLVSGKVLDLATGMAVGAEIPVVVYCKGATIFGKEYFNVYEMKTDVNGIYSYSALGVTPEEKCEYGDEAWIEVTYNDVKYTSKPFYLRREKDSSTTVTAASLATPAVPEFNTMTLGLTVVVAGLGLVLLRKR
jgi:hypothetical protein